MKHIRRTLLLALFGVSLVAAKDYTFEMADKVMVGQTQLEPGKYAIGLDGDKAVLKDKSGKSIDVKTKIEATPDKARATVCGLSADRQQLRSVTLRGTQTRVVFE
jgi:hypothetical protein